VVVPDIGFPEVDLSFCNCSFAPGGGVGGSIADTVAGSAGLALGILSASHDQNNQLLSCNEDCCKCNE